MGGNAFRILAGRLEEEHIVENLSVLVSVRTILRCALSFTSIQQMWC
jgi:hypothetical protein